MQLKGLLFFIVPFGVMIVVFFCVIGVRHKYPETPQISEDPEIKTWREERERNHANSERSSFVRSNVAKLEEAGVSYTLKERSVRIDPYTWDQMDLNQKHTFVDLFSEYFKNETGKEDLTVLSNRNDQQFASKSIFGNISVNR